MFCPPDLIERKRPVQLDKTCPNIVFFYSQMKKKTSQDHKTLAQLHIIGCQGVRLFLLNYTLKVFFLLINLVFSQFGFWVLSQFVVFSFFLLHNFTFRKLSLFEFLLRLQFGLLSFFTIWVLRFVTIWVWFFSSLFEFLRFVTI